MGKILAVVFLMVARGAAYGVKAYLPVLKGQDAAQADATPATRPDVGFQKVAPVSNPGCVGQGARKVCKVIKSGT